MSAAQNIGSSPSPLTTEGEFVRQWTPLCRHLAYSYAHSQLMRWYEVDDLIAIAQGVLWEAHSGYQSDRGATFKTYAYHLIVHHFENLKRYWQAKRRRGAWRSDSIEQDADKELPRLGWLRADSAAQDQSFHSEEIARHLRQAWETLRPMERRVLEARFADERALEDIAVEIDLSRERVRQLEKQALKRLRAAMAQTYPELHEAPPVTSCTRVRARTDDEIHNQRHYREARKVALAARVT